MSEQLKKNGKKLEQNLILFFVGSISLIFITLGSLYWASSTMSNNMTKVSVNVVQIQLTSQELYSTLLKIFDEQNNVASSTSIEQLSKKDIRAKNHEVLREKTKYLIQAVTDSDVSEQGIDLQKIILLSNDIETFIEEDIEIYETKSEILKKKKRLTVVLNRLDETLTQFVTTSFSFSGKETFKYRRSLQKLKSEISPRGVLTNKARRTLQKTVFGIGIKKQAVIRESITDALKLSRYVSEIIWTPDQDALTSLKANEIQQVSDSISDNFDALEEMISEGDTQASEKLLKLRKLYADAISDLYLSPEGETLYELRSKILAKESFASLLRINGRATANRLLSHLESIQKSSQKISGHYEQKTENRKHQKNRRIRQYWSYHSLPFDRCFRGSSSKV